MSGTFTEKIKLDEEQRQIIIDSVHDEVHEGEMMHVGYSSASVANNASLNVLLTTGNAEVHAVIRYSAGGEGQCYLYEAPTVVNGTGLTIYNMKRTSTRTPATVAKHTPTVSATGSTALVDEFLPGGSGGLAGGGAVRLGTEWILKPDTDYLLRFTNQAATAQQVSIAVEFYEAS